MVRRRSSFKLNLPKLALVFKPYQILVFKTAFLFLRKLPKFFKPGRFFKKWKYLMFFFLNTWNWVKIAVIYLTRIRVSFLINFKTLFIKINNFPELKFLYKLLFFKNEHTIFCCFKFTPIFLANLPLIFEFLGTIYVLKDLKKKFFSRQIFFYLNLVSFIEFYKLTILLQYRTLFI